MYVCMYVYMYVTKSSETTNKPQNEPIWQLYFFTEDGQVLFHQNDGTKKISEKKIIPNLMKANKGAYKRF